MRNLICVVMLFVCVVMFGGISGVAVEAQGAQEAQAWEFRKEVAVQLDNANATSGFLYYDGEFNVETGLLSPELAKMSAVLATAAYSGSDIFYCLNEMGFRDIKQVNYSRENTYVDNDFVAFSMAHKRSGQKNVYIIAVRGTPKSCEWFSDFDLGDPALYNGYHKGFCLAAQGVLDCIGEYVSTSNNVFLVTGHSRGAAVSNIVAAKLSKRSDLGADSDSVMAYTYACPNVRQNIQGYYPNIWNLNIPGDVIPALPLEKWGYGKYGTTLTLPTNDKVIPIYDNFLYQFGRAHSGAQYQGLPSVDHVEETIGRIYRNPEEFSTKGRLLFDILAMMLGPGYSEDMVAQIIAANGVSFVADEVYVLKTFCRLFTYNRSFDAQIVYQNIFSLEESLTKALTETAGLTPDEFANWGSGNGLFSLVNDRLFITITSPADINKALIKIKATDSFYSAFLINDLREVLSLFFAETMDGYEIFSLKDGVGQAHEPLSYILWINSMYCGYRGWAEYPDISIYDMKHFDPGLKTIGYQCFYECDNIQEVVLRDNFFILGTSAFANCLSLEKLQIPVDYEYENSCWWFYGCDQLKEIYYTATRNTILPDREPGDDTIEHYFAQKLETVRFDDEITEIGDYAFANHGYGYGGKISDIILPSSLTRIGKYAFENQHDGITALLVIPEGITEISEGAFSHCEGIQKVIFPDGLTSIKEGAFEHCSSLSQDLVFSNHDLVVEDDAFYECESITSLEIQYPDIVLGNAVFYRCTSLSEITIPVDYQYTTRPFVEMSVSKVCYTSGETGIMPDRIFSETSTSGGYPDNYWRYTLESNSPIESVEFEEGIRKIGAGAFEYCNTIQEIHFPSTLESIGDSAFARCNISNLDLPVNLKNIGKGAFLGCEKLSGTLEIDCTVLTIGPYAFKYCDSLDGLEILGTDITLFEDAFSYCSNLKEVRVPIDVNYEWSTDTNANPAFWNDNAIEAIRYTKGKTGVMPERKEGGLGVNNSHFSTLETICIDNVKDIYIEEGVRRLEKNVLNDDRRWEPSWQMIHLPESLESIDESAFYHGYDMNTILCGAKGSAAEAYAEKYQIPFFTNEEASVGACMMIYNTLSAITSETEEISCYGFVLHHEHTQNLTLDTPGNVSVRYTEAQDNCYSLNLDIGYGTFYTARPYIVLKDGSVRYGNYINM